MREISNFGGQSLYRIRRLDGRDNEEVDKKSRKGDEADLLPVHRTRSIGIPVENPEDGRA